MAALALVCVFFTQVAATETLRQSPSSGFAWLTVAFFGLAACWSLARVWRPRAHVVIGDDGVTHIPAGLHLAWNEIARVRIESYQTTTILHRRLVIVGREAELMVVELALTTPSWERTAASIERSSGREVGTRRVSAWRGVRARS